VDPSLSKHGEAIVAAIAAAPRYLVVPNPAWISEVPFLGGVYVLWKPAEEGWVPRYVGESSNLWDRLDEITRLGRHNGLRKLAANKVKNVSILSDPEIVGLAVSFVVVPVGRKEAEDYLVALWRSTVANKHDQRFKRRSDWKTFEALQTWKA
jgi:hypothetical protein